MKRIDLFLLMICVICGFGTASASLNLTIRDAGYNHVTWSYDDATSAYTFVTQGNDPFVLTEGFSRALTSGEVVITFEYKLDQAINDLQIFFKGKYNNWSDAYSIKNQQLIATSEWAVFSVNVSQQLSDWGVGSIGDQFRLDLGGASGKTIQIRHLRV